MAFPTKAKYVIIGAGIHGLSTAWHLAKKIKKNGNRNNNDIVVIDKGGYYMAFNKDTSADVISKVKKAFNEIKNAGQLEKLKSKYLK